MNTNIKKQALVVTGAVILLISLLVGVFFMFRGSNDKVKITFDTGGGSAVASQVIKKGTRAKRPTNPTRKGYTFDDWYLKNKPFDFNTKIDTDITLVAKWTIAQQGDKLPADDETTPDESTSTDETGDSTTTSTKSAASQTNYTIQTNYANQTNYTNYTNYTNLLSSHFRL